MTDKIAVITDSAADIPLDIAKELNIFIVPMIINCHDGEFRDGVDITVEEIYNRVKEQLPKTSLPAGDDILAVLDEVKSQGYNKAVVLTLSSGLSGTYGVFSVLSDYNDDVEVEVFDSKTASIGNGAIAITAAKYISEGMDFETLKTKIHKLIKDTKVFFAIDTLEFLEKGGRIGKATAVAGAVLQIKPILSLHPEDGDIYNPLKVRGNKQVPGALVKLVSSEIKDDRKYNLMVADGGVPEKRELVEQMLKEACPNYVNVYRAQIGGALGVYLGPGLVGAGIQFIEE